MHTTVEGSTTTAGPAPGGTTGPTFAHLVRVGAALATAGAGFLHLDAAGDHTEHAHIAGFFVVVAIAQFAVAGLLATAVRPRRATVLAAVLNGGVLVTWLLSRTVGLGFVPLAGEVEAIGWKDVAASGLELGTLAMLGLALVMPAAAGAVVVADRVGRRVLAGMAAATLALTVPGVLVAHEHGAHGHGAGADAAHADGDHAHVDGELASVGVEVHDHADDPAGPAHTHDEAGELVTNPDGTPHLHGEVIEGTPTAAGDAGHGDDHAHESGSGTAAAAAVAAAGGSGAAHAHGSGSAAGAGSAVGHGHGSDPAAGSGHGAGTGSASGGAGASTDHAHGDTGDAGHADHGAAATYDPGPQVADALAGPGRISTVRVGPFPLLPAIPQLDLHALESPALPLILPGHLNLPMVNVPKPCTDCFILGMQPDLVFADGRPANLDSGPMLHHTVLFDVGRTDPVCDRGTLLGNIGRRFFAAGNERTGFDFPDGYGMRVGDGMWAGLTELMNTSNQLHLVYLELAVRWVPADMPGIAPVTPVWLDIDSCGDSQFNVPAGISEQTWDWPATLTGRVVTAGGHLHDGGVWLAAENVTSGEHLCTSVAGYGTKPAYVGALETMTTCVWDRLSTIRAGDTIRLTSHYNTTARAQKVMGIMMIFVHETDDVGAGQPSPYPVEPPPDGAPPTGAGHAH